MNERVLPFAHLSVARVVLAFAALVIAAPVALGQTATNVWTSTTSGNWSDSNNWLNGSVPSSDGTALNSAAVIQFTGSGSTSYTATNDLGDPFLLLGLTFSSTSTQPINLGGGALSFSPGPAASGGTGVAFINQNGTGTVNVANDFTTNSASTTGNDVQLGGIGYGTVNLTGSITGTGGLALSNANQGTFIVSGTAAFGTSTLTGGVDMPAPATLKFTTTTGPIAAGGSSGIRLSAGNLIFAPAGSGQDVNLTLTTGTATFLANAGGTLVLDKGQNNSLTANFRVLTRTVGGSSSGTLVISPASGIDNLGSTTGERFIPSVQQANLNGLIVPVVVGQASTSDSSGDFIQNNAAGGALTGFVKFQGYTNYNTPGGAFSTSTAKTETSNVTADTVASADATLANLRVHKSTLTIGATNTVTLGGAAYSTVPQAGLILNNATITGGTLALGSVATEADVYTSAGLSTIASKITSANTSASAPALVKFGPGTLLLTNTSNTFTTGGIITLYGGTLAINGPGGNSDATVLGAGARSILVRGGGFEVMNGNYAPPASTKTFTIGTGGATFDVEDVSIFTLAQASQFAPVSGAGPIFKTGTGTFVLGGNYALTGLTALAAKQGTFLVNGTTTVSVPALADPGGTFGGSGTIVGGLTVFNGGTVAPGALNAIGKFTTGGATFIGGGKYLLNYNPTASASPTAGTDNDELVSASGTLDLSNLDPTSKFVIDLEPLGAGLPTGSPITVTAGQFGSVTLPNGVTTGDITSLFSFTGLYSGTPTVSTDGSSLAVSFTPVAAPEPTTLLLATGAGLLLTLRPRRRRAA